MRLVWTVDIHQPPKNIHLIWDQGPKYQHLCHAAIIFWWYCYTSLLQLWSVIEQVLLEDLSQDSFDKKTPNVKQKVFLERRTHESRGERPESARKITNSGGGDDLESFDNFEEERSKCLEGVDLDCYLKEELDKHDKQRQGGEFLKSSRISKGRCLPVVRKILPKDRPLSPSTTEPKKVFRCNINGCTKTYVKSSHLKVIIDCFQGQVNYT